MTAVEELAKARGVVGFHVAYKRNGRGEHVVPIIFPTQRHDRGSRWCSISLLSEVRPQDRVTAA
jgi:hypothetical protein